MWLVLVVCKGGYRVHSVHLTEQAAREWSACKEHDGENSSIAQIGDYEIEAIVVLHEQQKVS